ncbi:MAG TPA: Trm112 family protein [Hyphomicrobiales bacterium]|nr:Trm112 family protein [Hyphomicrobiales bacterium]
MDKKLLSILVCPLCKSPLVYDREAGELLCYPDGLAYPIRDGIPVMLDTEARVLTQEEKDRRGKRTP